MIGYTLDEAREVLAAAGWPAADVVETRPPRRTPAGPARVVRERVGPGGRLVLVVCGERVEGGRT